MSKLSGPCKKDQKPENVDKLIALYNFLPSLIKGKFGTNFKFENEYNVIIFLPGDLEMGLSKLSNIAYFCSLSSLSTSCSFFLSFASFGTYVGAKKSVFWCRFTKSLI